MADANIHEKIADAHPKLRKGVVYCLTCGRTKRVDSGDAMRFGWPKCCGYTMSLDSPEERAGRRALEESNG